MTTELFTLIDTADAAGKLTADSPANLKSWLTRECVAQYRPRLEALIRAGEWWMKCSGPQFRSALVDDVVQWEKWDRRQLMIERLLNRLMEWPFICDPQGVQPAAQL